SFADFHAVFDDDSGPSVINSQRIQIRQIRKTRLPHSTVIQDAGIEPWLPVMIRILTGECGRGIYILLVSVDCEVVKEPGTVLHFILVHHVSVGAVISPAVQSVGAAPAVGPDGYACVRSVH